MFKLNRSDVVLAWIARDLPAEELSYELPESMLREYGVTVWGWGEDPMHVEPGFHDRMLAHLRKLGVRGLTVCNCLNLSPTPKTPSGQWIRTDPELKQARVVDFNGEPIPMPFWPLEYGEEGAFWLCSSNPAYRRLMRWKILTGLRAGANIVCNDNFMTGTINPAFVVYWPHSVNALVGAFGGCFCKHCVAGFREYLRHRKTPGELEQLGIRDLDRFDYRKMVRQIAPRREEFVGAYDQGRIPLIEEYQDYHLESCAALQAELRAFTTEAAGEPVAVGANMPSLFPNELVGIDATDYVHPETSYLGKPGNLPVLMYKLAEALDKPVANWPSGGDARYIAEENRHDLMKVWIAASYALGGALMVPYRMWTHTSPTGMHWYDPPPSLLGPMYRFVRREAPLFDDYRSVEQVKLLYSNADVRLRFREMASPENRARARELARSDRGELDVVDAPLVGTAVHQAAWDLFNASIPFGLALAGDKWLRRQLRPGDVAAGDVVIVPEPSCLDAAQAQALARGAAGRIVTWRSSSDLGTVLKRIRPMVRVDPGVWAVPRRKADPAAPLVVHLISSRYDPKTNRLPAASKVQVRLDHALIGSRQVRGLWLHAPERPQAEPLRFEIDAEGLSVRIPGVAVWGILRIDYER